MAVKQVSMMTTIKTDPYEAQFISNGHKESVARHDRRMSAFREEVSHAEAELNDLLNEGYRHVTQYEVETHDYKCIVMVMFKPDN